MRVLTFLLLLCSIGFAQTDTLSLSFYPLHENNYWEYRKSIRWDWESRTDTIYYSLKIIGDSTLPNQKNYKIVQRRQFGSGVSPNAYLYFERIDTLTCQVFRYEPGYGENEEYLIDDLKMSENDSSDSRRGRTFEYENNPPTICVDFSRQNIFGDSLCTKQFENIGLSPHDYLLVEGIGLYSFNAGFDFGYTEIELQYAKIDAKIYGDKVNSIELVEFPSLPSHDYLYQNYPNPFNSITLIKYFLEKPAEIEIVLYSINGEKIKLLHKGYDSAGNHHLTFDANDIASGVYFYMIKSNEFVKSKKCILVK